MDYLSNEKKIDEWRARRGGVRGTKHPTNTAIPKDPTIKTSNKFFSELWTSARESTGGKQIGALVERTKQTTVGTWWMAKSPLARTAWTIGSTMLALTGIRLLSESLKPEHQSPPPAYQAAYNRIDGMQKGGMTEAMRQIWSDFGSPANLDKMVRRKIMKRTHNIGHRQFTGVTL
jgi:hypothetical protein